MKGSGEINEDRMVLEQQHGVKGITKTEVACYESRTTANSSLWAELHCMSKERARLRLDHLMRQAFQSVRIS